MYTIKQAAIRSGVSVPLLRAWERRYGIVNPARTLSGYRLYDDAALERLSSMRRLVDAGWAPSTAAAAVLDGTAPPPPQPAAEVPVQPLDAPPPPTSTLTTRFVDAAAAFDGPALEQALDEMFAAGSFEQVAEQHLHPALHAVGDAWAGGTIDVASEHAASHAVLRRLAAAFEAAGRTPAPHGVVLVGLPPGGRHELGALAFGVAARRLGVPVLYLGPDLPIEDWVATAVRTAATAAVIGVVTAADADPAMAVASALLEARPDMVVALGGRAARAAAPIDAQGDGGTGLVILPEAIGDAARTVALAVARR